MNKKHFGILITAAVIVAFLAYFFLNTEKFRPLLHLNVFLLLLLFLANIASLFINGIFTKIILVPFKLLLPIAESFYVSLIASVGNFFAPVGAGLGFRAVYLKRKYNLSYSDYISILSGNYILVFLVNSFFGLLALYLLRARSNKEYYVLLIVFAIIFALSLLLSIFKVPVPSFDKSKRGKSQRLLSGVRRVMNGWHLIVSHRKLMLQLILLSLAGLGLNAAMTWLEIHAIHLTVSFAPLLLFSVLSLLSLFINITPANLGIKEAVFLFSSSVLGFSINQIVLIALVDRGVLFLVLLSAWVLMSWFRVDGRRQLGF